MCTDSYVYKCTCMCLSIRILCISGSQADLEVKLAQLQSERLAVMDELCDYLSEIPPADISTFFKPGATFVQKRLALRYTEQCYTRDLGFSVAPADMK